MNSVASKLIAQSAVILSLAAGAMGCADNNSTIFIRQAQLVLGGDCDLTNDPEGMHTTRGSLDVNQSLTNQYEAHLLVGNQLIGRGDEDTLRVETSRIQLFQANVEVFDFDGTSLAEFKQPISGFIDPAQGSEAVYGVTEVVLIDTTTLASLDLTTPRTLVSRVKVLGESIGGSDVETGFWDFPIEVCSGCFLCVNPTSCDDEFSQTCQPGQDGDILDCRCLDPDICPGAGCSI